MLWKRIKKIVTLVRFILHKFKTFYFEINPFKYIKFYVNNNANKLVTFTWNKAAVLKYCF